ncbi:hypothetical protein XM38_034270 [Halomicronema hongdechloris C2206]|uniref:N-acetyltransferase domain-containing protein n=1 Tax=Halomicronema hongdechloris C2206 TaxID=1641165 RepID=A0A1Z3HQ76_9CYAN|nr:hypothetical protein [Halomicronema hongdechloris]ASC72470.1 hypothetical protein XM38_034270 [Halomicronema hongdechloris C2206]
MVTGLGMAYGIAHYNAARLRVTIAAFNQRALRVWHRLGFQPMDRFVTTGADELFVIRVFDGGR